MHFGAASHFNSLWITQRNSCETTTNCICQFKFLLPDGAYSQRTHPCLLRGTLALIHTECVTPCTSRFGHASRAFSHWVTWADVQNSTIWSNFDTDVKKTTLMCAHMKTCFTLRASSSARDASPSHTTHVQFQVSSTHRATHSTPWIMWRIKRETGFWRYVPCVTHASWRAEFTKRSPCESVCLSHCRLSCFVPTVHYCANWSREQNTPQEYKVGSRWVRHPWRFSNGKLRQEVTEMSHASYVNHAQAKRNAPFTLRHLREMRHCRHRNARHIVVLVWS